MLARWTQRLRGTRRSRGNPRPASGANQAPASASGDGTTRAETADQSSDQEQDSETDHTAGENHRREVLLRTEARQRWNASVKPQSQAFKEIVSIFADKLEDGDMTVQEILDAYFTRHERDLVIPADKRHNMALARIQRRNRARYRMLIRSQRFAPWADQATSMELKLAMLWFGLPIAPIEFHAADESESGSDTADDIAEAETDKRREEAARNEKSLKFLNSYGKRHFGRDNLRDPDPTFEAYYALNHLYPVVSKTKRPAAHHRPESISLRGGGLSEDLVDMDVDDFNESDIDVENQSDTHWSDHDRTRDEQVSPKPTVSLRGGASISQPLLKRAMELSDQLYVPKETPKPGVHSATNPSQTERSEAGPSKGKEPARDLPQAGTGKGKGKGRAHDLPAISNPFMRSAAPKPQPPTREERQREMREAAYTKPPSVHTHNEMPQNAPPVEKVLRFGSDNVPMVSLGVLTPTEQRQMQLNYYLMRNVLLERSQKCPYRGCDRVIALDDEDRMQRHLADAHLGDRCNFCDEVLYAHWTVNQRRAHFLKQHADLFLSMVEMQDDNRFGDRARPHGQIDYERESRWTYCARCGRDHRDLDARADREHHDTVCYPGAPKGDYVACGECGVIHLRTQRHTHREVANTMEWPYCNDCGLATGLFSDLYRAKHQLYCRGFNSDDAKHCPWCGIEMHGYSNVKLHHMKQCVKRPDGAAEGPLDEKGEPWPYKPTVEEQVGEEEKQPPEVCAVCKKTIMHLDAHLLLKHIEDEHPGYTTTFCIFCKLDYGDRGWAGDRQKIVRHLDDHIHDRKEKMTYDLVETLDLPAHHPFRKHVLLRKDHAKVKDLMELKHTKELYERLRESSREEREECEGDKNVIYLLRQELAKTKKKLAEAEKGLSAQDAEAAPAAVATPAALATPAAASTSASASTPAGPATPATAPAAGQKKDKGKGKEKAKPAHKETAKTPAGTQTQPATAEKRKAGARPADPSYRPTGSESDSSDDAEFRAEEARLKAANKRKRTAGRDPSFRPGPDDEDA